MDLTLTLLAVVALLGLACLVLLTAVLRRLSAREGGEAERVLREELRAGREEIARAGAEQRRELADGLARSNKTLRETLAGITDLQKGQLEGLARRLQELAAGNQQSLEKVGGILDTRVRELAESNEKRLEEMRRTVDEKLQGTLEKRLGESFKMVSERLEKVHQGLGEMQSLAAGVGDLKRVLTNVKARGTWAEVQLGALLDQILVPGQYDRNVKTRAGSNDMVEYAVRLPGPRDDPGAVVWLPIDSKFPQEDYLRLQEASDAGDADGVQKATAALIRAVQKAASDVRDKYLDPPGTTDFAILYLATEGMYAEVLRQPGLMEDLQQNHRVVVAGPTTITAILSSLRMGFQTLAIEKRASEVWKVLAAVKTEFGKFGGVLEKIEKQLGTVSKTVQQTGVRTRAMERKLRSVEQLPADDAARLLELAPLPDPAGNEAADPGRPEDETS